MSHEERGRNAKQSQRNIKRSRKKLLKNTLADPNRQVEVLARVMNLMSRPANHCLVEKSMLPVVVVIVEEKC